MIYLIYATIFSAIAAFVVVLMLPKQKSDVYTYQALRENNGTNMYLQNRLESPAILKPFDLINKPLMSKANKERLERNLSTAKVRMSPEGFLGIKEIAMIALPLLGNMIAGGLDTIWLVVLAGLGFIVPDLWLRARLAKHKDEILKALPDSIDLLALCVGAGLDFVLATKAVIEKSNPNPLIDELQIVSQEIKMGKPRREALADMAKRLNMNEVSSFVRTLNQAERMGTSVAEALALLSEDARSTRFRRAERMALKAPIKLLFPLVFFILPVVAVIVGGPVILQFMQGGLKF